MRKITLQEGPSSPSFQCCVRFRLIHESMVINWKKVYSRRGGRRALQICFAQLQSCSAWLLVSHDGDRSHTQHPFYYLWNKVVYLLYVDPIYSATRTWNIFEPPELSKSSTNVLQTVLAPVAAIHMLWWKKTAHFLSNTIALDHNTIPFIHYYKIQ